MADNITQKTAQNSDVIISGAGLIGLTMALALAQAGVRVQIIDRRDAAAISPRSKDRGSKDQRSADTPKGADAATDIRATAIIRSSWEMFCALGLERALAPVSEPITAIEVRDGVDGKPLRFASESDAAAMGDIMGQMVPNAALAAALFDAVSAHELVTGYFGHAISAQEEDAHRALVTLDDGRLLQAPLMIIAEGRDSSTRDAKGFVPTRWQYDHRAIVATIGHSLPHHGIAHELFFPDGPLAMLPLPDDGLDNKPDDGLDDGPDNKPDNGPDDWRGRKDAQHRSSLVWSLPAAKAAGYEALSPRGFVAELAKILQPLFGDLSLIGERAAYPLSFHVVSRPVRGRSVVIGDGAHALHPIAGQGFNLGLRDVACLTEIVAESLRMGLDPGEPVRLERYSDWRDGDVTMMAAATDGLTRLFGLSSPPVRSIRRAGMAMVGGVPMIREMFASEARGEAGRLPRLLQGLDV